MSNQVSPWLAEFGAATDRPGPLDLFDHRDCASRGQMHLRVFTGKALTELARYHGLRPVTERSAGYYPFSGTLARHLAQLDRRHGTFLVHLYEPDHPS